MSLIEWFREEVRKTKGAIERDKRSFQQASKERASRRRLREQEAPSERMDRQIETYKGRQIIGFLITSSMFRVFGWSGVVFGLYMVVGTWGESKPYLSEGWIIFTIGMAFLAVNQLTNAVLAGAIDIQETLKHAAKTNDAS